MFVTETATLQLTNVKSHVCHSSPNTYDSMHIVYSHTSGIASGMEMTDLLTTVGWIAMTLVQIFMFPDDAGQNFTLLINKMD